jgi:hypothetical protein
MENTIHITVTGPYNSGKTMISQEIVDALRKLGLAVKWDVKPDFKFEDEARRDGLERISAIEAISDKTNIIVKEATVKKDFNSVLNAKVGHHVKNKDK